jgi:hypothetical protein
MSANQRLLEVDKFLTRELNIRNPDNSVPEANLSLLTDGKGGTYFRSAFNAQNPAGFNAINLVDSNERLVANLAYNTLNLKEGQGVALLKDTDNTIVIKAIAIIPSTFSYVSTPNGSIYAENIADTLKIIPNYGVTTNVSSNSLYIGGYPGINIVNVSTIKSTFGQIRASTNLSSLTIVPDFGIDIQVRRPDTIVIGTSAKHYSLNQLTLNSLETYNFDSKFNTLNFSARGNLSLQMNDNASVDFVTNSFSNIQTDTDSINSALTGATLKFLTGYGLQTSVVDSELRIKSTKPAFDKVKTLKGTISTQENYTELILNTGYGLTTDINENAITFSLDKPYVSEIKAGNVSTVATTSSILNLSAGNGIEYSNATSGALEIATTDFSELTAGNQVLKSENPLSKKKLKLKGLGNISIQGDPLTNTVSFLLTGGFSSTIGAPFAFSQVLIHSTITNINQNTDNFPGPFILNSAPNSSAALGITGVAPISVIPRYDFNKSSMFYVTVDKNQLFSDEMSTIKVSSMNILGTLTASQLENNSAKITSLNITNIASNIDTKTPLVNFDYKNNRIGINKNGLPGLATLDISGTVLAKTYATYSDPLLKEFKADYKVNQGALDRLIPKYFNWIADETHDVGFSAVDVECILPEAVKTGPTGLKMVDYSKLTIVAIASIHDSNKRIKALESTLKALMETKL